MKTQKTDIYILTGFLGSGKSTLLAQLLRDEKDKERHVGVLMNELGKISIDSSTVPTDTPLKELLNGCICCTIQGELSLQLKILLEEHDLDAIYIEATGAAHPIDVVDACTHPVLANKVNIKGVITLGDVKQWKEGRMSIKLKKLIKEQVKFADLLILNKTDTLESNELPMIIEDIKKINPKAQLKSTTYSQIDPKVLHMTKRLPQENELNNSDEGHHAQASEAHVYDHLHLTTFNFSLKSAIDRVAFLEWLKTVPGQVYRAKGFVMLTETPGLFLFNYSYSEPILERFHGGRRVQPVLVFIGDGLDHDKMKNDLIKLQLATLQK